MASSKAKKAEKKKDFQKTKLKVGKTKPKAANHTDTSFKARRITVKQQSFDADASSSQAKFSHHVSLLSSSSEAQRSESLVYLESALHSQAAVWSAPDLLDRLLPLLQDANGSVRNRLIKTLEALPKKNLEFLADKILLHVWAGMTNINLNIRASALLVLDWSIQVCGIELVECRGGWYTTLQTYLVMLGWSSGESTTGWSSNMALTANNKNIVKALDVLTNFLRLGLADSTSEIQGQAYTDPFELASQMHTRPEPYRILNLYGQTTENSQSFTRDAEHRREVFLHHFRVKFEAGIQEVRKQAGEAGRAAAKTSAVIVEAMKEADASKILQDQWALEMEERNRKTRARIWSRGFED